MEDPQTAPAEQAAPAEEFHAPDAVGAPAPAKKSVEQVVDDWFRHHFAGVAGSVHDHVFNTFNAAKEELKKLLAEL